jgi:hypothetical protein
VPAGVKKAKTNNLTLLLCFQLRPESAENWLGRVSAFFAGESTFRSLRQMWGRCQSGWKSERWRGTERALILGVERLAEIFNRFDGAGLKCGLRYKISDGIETVSEPRANGKKCVIVNLKYD